MFSKWWLFKRLVLGYVIWCFLSVFFFGCFFTPLYRVKEYYGAVITQIDGGRWTDKNVGIHSRINSWNPLKWAIGAESYSLRIEYIFLDNEPNPHEMQAADKIKFKGAGVWTYTIEDLEKFGIKMGENPVKNLTANLNGIAKAKIQSFDVEINVTKIDYINQQVEDCVDKKTLENEYGVKIKSFRMIHATYPDEMNQATADAKRIKIMAEASKTAATDLLTARSIRAEADKIQLIKLLEGSGVKSEEGRKKVLDTLRNLDFYEMLKERSSHETIYVIPHGEVTHFTLPDSNQKTTDKLLKKLTDEVDYLKNRKPDYSIGTSAQ